MLGRLSGYGTVAAAIMEGGLPDMVLWFAWAATAAMAGIIGTLIGGQWKQRHDWPRMIAFCMVLAALAYFWTSILYITEFVR
jgi:hypothetical protein